MSEPLPPGEVLSPRDNVCSPAELLKDFLDDNVDATLVPNGAVVGGADDEEQQGGVIALMDAGDTKRELYAPLLWKRVQVRCMGPTLDAADQIGNHAFDLLHNQRWLVLSDYLGRQFFVHGIYCSAGPSHHIDSTETWESLLFANVTVGRDPTFIPGSSS